MKYYRDPALHPTRQFIGVAYNKTDTLPYPKKEPRRRKLGMVAHVRKTREAPRPEVSDSGIPNKVLRKAGLWNIEALERRLWNADKRRELREAHEQRAREAKAALAGLPLQAAAPDAVSVADVAVSSAEAVSISKTSGYTSPDTFAAAATAGAVAVAPLATGPAANEPVAKTPFQRERTRPVTPGEFLQKSWQERRHTKVLLLNPRSYAYAESNAAIGRLSAKSMYTPPWKLGGRKSRFRSRRRRAVAKIAKAKADKELVRREKEKERLAEEKKRAARLEKQRARGAKKADATQAGQGAAQKIEASEAVDSVPAQERAQPVEVEEAEKPATEAEETPVAVEESKKPAESKEGDKPIES